MAAYCPRRTLFNLFKCEHNGEQNVNKSGVTVMFIERHVLSWNCMEDLTLTLRNVGF